ncbi:MAG TPA: hypothetical protein VF808_20490 [Ktedonobacterales bacterium]
MAVTQEREPPESQEAFSQPSISVLLDMTWPQFEDFIQYVFECACYHVHKVASYRHRYHFDLQLGEKAEAEVDAISERLALSQAARPRKPIWSTSWRMLGEYTCASG